MHAAQTESNAIEAGNTRLSAADLEGLLLGQTTRGLYRGGFQFITYMGHDYTMEGRNHVGAHNFGVCSFDDDAGTMTVTWENGWDHNTTRAYRAGDDVHFFDSESGDWRFTFSEFVPGRQPLHLS